MNWLFILFLSVASSCATTTTVYQVWQPLSLLGTDVESVPNVASVVPRAVSMPRPVVVSGAIPEGVVAAIAVEHPMAAVGWHTELSAVNLLNVAKVDLMALLDGNTLTVQFDLSEAGVPKKYGVTLEQVLDLGIDSLRKTLKFNAKGQLDEPLLCEIKILGVKKDSALMKYETSFKVAIDDQ